ncbi:MAG: DNA replication and repair protein RecF, partial [Gemmatimonadota bacterium]
AAITGGVGAALEHEPGIPGLGQGPWERDDVEAAFREALQVSRDRERRRGTTVVGPHRDELRIRVGPPERRRDVRRFGSGGERRSVALALRLLEADTVRSEKGREPILLMDDVFAELDGERSERLLTLLMEGSGGQILLTAPKETDVRLPPSRLPRWSIGAGEISS